MRTFFVTLDSGVDVGSETNKKIGDTAQSLFQENVKPVSTTEEETVFEIKQGSFSDEDFFKKLKIFFEETKPMAPHFTFFGGDNVQ